MATSVPKKDPKNDFIYLRYCGVFSLFRGSWAAQRQFPDRYRSTLEQPDSFRKYGVYLLLAVVLTSFCRFANGETAHQGKPTPQPAVSENPAVASDLVDVVQAFLAAGEKDDPTARGKYLGPKVFYYGHSRTHAQAVSAIASLYRRWPRRKFTLTESINLFAIPNTRGVYRVTAVYEYKFDNLDEHLSGKSKLTCVVEHDQQGTRIIGVDEKLINGSTVYQKE
jgi:hypothetical protein